jgi:hypothetical protein
MDEDYNGPIAASAVPKDREAFALARGKTVQAVDARELHVLLRSDVSDSTEAADDEQELTRMHEAVLIDI